MCEIHLIMVYLFDPKKGKKNTTKIKSLIFLVNFEDWVTELLLHTEWNNNDYVSERQLYLCIESNNLHTVV